MLNGGLRVDAGPIAVTPELIFSKADYAVALVDALGCAEYSRPESHWLLLLAITVAAPL
jgi:hypothetical protein